MKGNKKINITKNLSTIQLSKRINDVAHDLNLFLLYKLFI